MDLGNTVQSLEIDGNFRKENFSECILIFSFLVEELLVSVETAPTETADQSKENSIRYPVTIEESGNIFKMNT